MGLQGDPGGGNDRGFFMQQCASCGCQERCSVCRSGGCRQQFVPQPGYSTKLCPRHDPGLDAAPGSYREYKMKKALECARCGEPLLEAENAS